MSKSFRPSVPSAPSADRNGQPFSTTTEADQPFFKTALTTAAELRYAYIAPDLQSFAFPVTDLRFAPDNARAHNERSTAAVADSLRLRQQKPIVAKATYRGLSNVVLAGNGTLRAALRLGWSHVAVVWFEGTDDEAREYAIRDNRTQEQSEWDVPQLVSLQADGVDLTSLGWNDGELLDLLGSDDAPVPLFEPEVPAYRLDHLVPDATCPACGHRFKQGAR